MADPREYSGMPRWAKVFAILAFAVALLFIVLMLGGGRGRHGPHRHMPSGGGSGQTAPSTAQP